MTNTHKNAPVASAQPNNVNSQNTWALRCSLVAVATLAAPHAAFAADTPLGGAVGDTRTAYAPVAASSYAPVIATATATATATAPVAIPAAGPAAAPTQATGSEIVYTSVPVIQQVQSSSSANAIAAVTAHQTAAHIGAPTPQRAVQRASARSSVPVVTGIEQGSASAPQSVNPAIQSAAANTPSASDVSGADRVLVRETDREPRGISTGNSNEIRFRADTLVVTPVLNVGLVESARTAVVGEPVTFLAYNNYPAFVTKSEVRIFEASQSTDSEPLAVLEVNDLGAAQWQVRADVPSALFYVLRVYGAGEKFDETHAEELTIVEERLDELQEDVVVNRPNFGTIDEAANRSIDLGGMMATVTGFADPEKDIVFVAGQAVPIDDNGRFAAQQIVARQGSLSNLRVWIERDGRTIHEVEQSFAVPKDDWFVVGQGDLTLGQSFSSGPAADVSGDSLAEGSYAIGRAAFYAKGVIGDDDGDDSNDIRITASLDTGETLLEDLFSNLDRKDPGQLLRRLNRDQYYPTYGDNSTLVEDAPTQGRFYFRAAKDDSQFVVGNFVTNVVGAELAQLDRGLFGALIDYNSSGITSFGERKAQITAFASDPGTLPAREEFRGTGGSLYFLERQDISIGSERVRIEVRDRNTGLVLESRDLNAQQDYDFDPYQGRLTLLTPLASTVANGGTVREGSSAGNVPVLVVRYEFTPLVGDLDGYTVGGRATGWLGETVRFGATAQRDTVEEAAQTLVGADLMLRLTAGTYLKGEIAQTDGPGFGQSNSVDGGLSFTNIANPGTGNSARAYRAEGAVNFAELAEKTGDLGSLHGYFETFDQGFASSGFLTPSDTTRWGAAASVPLGENVSVAAKYDELTTDNTGDSKTGSVDLEGSIMAGSGRLTSRVGLRYEDRTPGTLFNSVQDGTRTDAALELEYAPSRDFAFHGFGQATLDRDALRQRNNRYGAGVNAQLTERLSVASEVSGGDGGMGADVQLNHRLGEGSEAYVGYALFADRTDTGLDSQNIFTRSNRGTLTVGARQRFTDSLSVYGENRIGIGGTAPALTRSFGLQFEPTEKISITGSFENGRIDDVTTGLFRRTAGSLGFGYVTEGVRFGSSVEVRTENSVTIDQTVWLLRNDFSYAVDPSWTALGRFNLARADQSSPSISAAEFTEAVAGVAFRPVNNERFNALFRVTYFEDLGPVGQVTGSGQTESPKQSSTIFNADFNYDLDEWITLGAKYGYRGGRVSVTRDSDVFVSSDAHLAVIRADFHVNQKWDVLAEGRALWVTQADDMRLGALGAIYRHVGNNVKIGVGYSLSDFSDDLTDQSFTSHGPFLNLLSKF